ncbi:hypothetical protein EG68_06202 [Paragonimus skrjabini miyazakii]|uniref:Uncharacterized protein n=1 Tax=Paragonimus skrjabini miyazakii TaxID=59628 RepID=A0A8S9YYH9_9TREM|nr:hypothetical protein EG68_06202 [Paragonimus skrjabini miyazakii]
MHRFHDLCRGRIAPEDLPLVSPKTLYFFICSAYVGNSLLHPCFAGASGNGSDRPEEHFTLERRTLAEEVYPELKEYTRQRYGLELQVSE